MHGFRTDVNTVHMLYIIHYHAVLHYRCFLCDIGVSAFDTHPMCCDTHLEYPPSGRYFKKDVSILSM